MWGRDGSRCSMNKRRAERLLQRGIVALHGQYHRSPSSAILHLRISSRTKQPVNHRGLSRQAVCAGFAGRFPETSDCLVKWGKSNPVPDGCLPPCGEERFDAGQMALQAGFVQRGVSLPIAGVYFRALIQEQEDERKVAPCCRGDERRGSSGVAGFDIGSAVE